MDITQENVNLNDDGTITISLEDAQIILQEQGIDGTVQIGPGTYHILTQEGIQVTEDGVAVTEGPIDESVGITVLHHTGVSDLGDYNTESGVVTESVQVDNALFQNEAEGQVINEQATSKEDGGEEGITLSMDTENGGMKVQNLVVTSEGLLATETVINESDLNALKNPQSNGIIENQQNQDVGEQQTVVNIVTQPQGLTEVQAQASDDTHPQVIDATQSHVIIEAHPQTLTGETQQGTLDEIQSEALSETQSADTLSEIQPVDIGETQQQNLGETPTQESVSETQTEPGKDEKKLDLTKPIQVTDQTVVVVNGKKCVLMANPDTGQLCAYPVLPPSDGRCLTTGKKRKRGRPRRDPTAEAQKAAGQQATPQKSQTSIDGQKTPQNSTSLEQTNSAAEGLLELSNTGPDGIRRSARKRQKNKVLDADYEILEVSSDDGQNDDDDDDGDVTPTGAVKKRKQSDSNEYNPFSPYIMPGSGVKRGRGRPRRYPPPGQSSTTQIPAVVIPGANGQTIMMAPVQGLQNFQNLQQQLKSLPTGTLLASKPAEGSGDNTQIITVTTTDALSADTNTVVGDDIPVDSNQNSADDGDGELEQAAASAETIMSAAPLPENDCETGDEASKSESTTGDTDQQTIIQIPENLLPMFLPKKDPVKIGLKASENELEKLKCSKCDYQAFYPQQYQAHIASHTEDVQKCKCCNFYTFDKEDLLSHIKETHPRCICPVCNFTAEHAYVIKRHMMRHNANGCTCELCGKVYKDQYILKMHVKMVHMPAEVLFECTICLKKFTRKAHLKRHLRIHEPEKPFKCPHCDYRGCERSDISKHLLIHEEPKHVCDVCGKAFRHIKNKELHLKRHTGQKDYKCGVCDFYGYTFTDIRKHIERKHADIKTLVCDKCGSVFKSEILLREHQKQQCEVFMIEQALAIATSTGMSQATLQIPSSLTVDGQQITIDSQQIALDNGQVNITVEQVSLPEDDGIEITEEQIQASLQDGSIAVTQAQIIETDSVAEMSELQEQVEEDGEIIEEEDVELSGTEEELSIAMV